MTTPRLEKKTDYAKLHFALKFINFKRVELHKQHRLVMKDLRKRKSVYSIRDKHKLEDGMDSLEYAYNILKKYR
jgi:hypothetical protein